MAEINPDYERGFKDGLKSKIGAELQPMIAQVLEGISEAIKGLIPRMIDIMEITANLDAYDWIPCSERMPDDIKPVLITWANNSPVMSCHENDKGKPFTGAAHYCNGKWYWYSQFSEDILGEYGEYQETVDVDVLAWMPMPEAYKPQEGGEHDD